MKNVIYQKNTRKAQKHKETDITNDCFQLTGN